MARPRAILQADSPYHITARCINREWFNLPMWQVWEVFAEELYLTTHFHNLRSHAFVLMNNHFHLIASTPDANISDCMRYLLANVSRRLNELGNRINGTFAGRHYKTVLYHPTCVLNAYKYVYRNPLSAGICSRAEDYPFSTLQGLLGRSRLIIPLVEDTTLFSDVEGCLRWLNEAPDAAKLEAVRWALKRPVYAPKKCSKTNRPLMGELDVL